MSMLRDALTGLAAAFDDHVAEPVVYRRGNDEDTILATPCRVAVSTEIRLATGVNARTMQFVVTSANLPAWVGTPLINDEIDYLGETWVLSPFEGEYVWRYADSSAIRIRLFAALKKEVN